MKSRKKIFSTLMGIAITSQILPSTYTIVANAQTPNNTNILIKNPVQELQTEVNNQEQTQVQDDNQAQELQTEVTTQEQTKVQDENKAQINNTITLAGVGCQEGTHSFQISFDTETNKLKVAILSGLGYTGTHPFHPYFTGEYIRITLLDEDGNIKNELSLKGTENVSKVRDLNEWHFEYGDRLRIKHEEADWRTKIDGNVTNEEGNPVQGLNDRTSKDVLNKYDFEITKSGLHEVEAFTNELNKTKITLSGVGCQEGTHGFEVTLDPKTKKFGVNIISGLGYTGTHPFHPSFKDEYIRISLLNNKGNIKNEFTMKGTDNVGKVKKELSKWNFEYGDHLSIFHEQAGWRTKIDGNVTDTSGNPVQGLNNETSKDVLNNYDFEITKSGLHEVKAFTNELSKTKIILSGVGCQEGTHGFEVTLDPRTKKFGVNILHGLGYTGTHPFHPSFEGEYIRIALFDNKGNIKKDFTMTGTDNVGKVEKELSKWKFDYGYRLRIFHEQAGWRTKIEGNVTNAQGNAISGLNNATSKEDLNRYDFEITRSGLKEVEKKIVEVSNADQLIEKLKDKTQKTIKLTEDITFTKEDVSKFKDGVNGSKELIIGKGVSIEGDSHFIDFNGLGSLTLKGDNIRLSNVTIKGCSNIGMQVYNSQQVYLKNVTVESCKEYGLFVNASNVKLENCTIKNNKEGGILISRSMALQDDNKYTDSEVKVIGRLNQDGQSGIQVLIKNLEMLDGRMQKNTFIPSKNQEYKISTDEHSVTLSDIYCQILGISPDRKFMEIIYKYNKPTS